ncbi:MAG: hypothetical protein N2512_00390 [Armatimonadetes bacterium]|nr:hypothetical protein [Armatimonadota bacterium]
MKAPQWVAILCAFHIASLALGQAEVRATVMLDRTQAGALTGRYYVKVTLENCPTARMCTFRLNLPTAYAFNNAAASANTWIVDMRAGADVETIQAGSPPTAAPVLFAEAATGTNVKGVQVVALLKAEAKNSKHVCDIVFTSRGRATLAPITFEAGSVSVKDQALNPITAPARVVRANAHFGDLNWDGGIGLNDFDAWVTAWKQGTDLPFADIAPVVSGSASQPATALSSQTPSGIGLDDFDAWVTAWKSSQ